MSIAFVQKTDGNVSGGPTGSLGTVWGGNPTTGNAVLVCVFWKSDTTITSVTDSQSNTYVDCGAGRLARPTDGFLQIFGAKNITGGTTPTVTVNWNVGTAFEIDVYLLEYLGADISSLFDSVTATGTATSGSTLTTGNFTPTITNGAVIAFAGSNSGTTVVAGASFTLRCGPAAYGEGVEDQIFTSSLGTITAGMDMGGALTKGGIIACVIKAAASGTTVLPGSGALTLTGFAPTISTTPSGVTVNPDVGALVLTGFEPTIGLPVTVSPDVGGLVFTGFAPTIDTGAPPAVIQQPSGGGRRIPNKYESLKPRLARAAAIRRELAEERKRLAELKKQQAKVEVQYKAIALPERQSVPVSLPHRSEREHRANLLELEIKEYEQRVALQNAKVRALRKEADQARREAEARVEQDTADEAMRAHEAMLIQDEWQSQENARLQQEADDDEMQAILMLIHEDEDL
jgi:hypothetical protein